MSYGGPHYGFLAARSEYIRKLPGRIVGETVRRRGQSAAIVLTLQTREQHIRREKATSNITTNQTLLASARAGLPVAGSGRTACASRRSLPGAVRAREGRRLGVPLAFRPPDLQGVRGPHRPARRRGDPGRPEAAACIPATRSGATTPGMDDALLVAVTEKRTAAEIDRLAEVLARGGGGGMKLIYEKSRAGRRGIAYRRSGRCPVRRGPGRARPRARRRGCPSWPSPRCVRHFTELSTRNFGIDTGFYPLGSCTMKYNPRINERARRAARLPRPPPAHRTTTAPRARSSSSGGCRRSCAR